MAAMDKIFQPVTEIAIPMCFSAIDSRTEGEYGKGVQYSVHLENCTREVKQKFKLRTYLTKVNNGRAKVLWLQFVSINIAFCICSPKLLHVLRS